MEPPNIIKAIRTLREVRDISFREARDKAIQMYRQRGWAIPESIARLEGK